MIGTPDDAIAKIEELVEASDGGFGAFLLFDHDWAPPAAKLRSYELFAQYVMPHFTGQLAGPVASRDWVTGSGTSSSTGPRTRSARRSRTTLRSRRPRRPLADLTATGGYRRAPESTSRSPRLQQL